MVEIVGHISGKRVPASASGLSEYAEDNEGAGAMVDAMVEATKGMIKKLDEVNHELDAYLATPLKSVSDGE